MKEKGANVKQLVVITGASSGMGEAAVLKFLTELDYEVVGIDILPMSERVSVHPGASTRYHHYVSDVSRKETLPNLIGVNILINSAGVQGTDKDIDVNLRGVINCTEKYALNNPKIKSVLNQASVSASMGTEFPQYVASKGGVISYTKWTAKDIAKFGATCNSLSFGGVLTDINRPVTDNPELWNQVMELTPLKQWTSVEETAEWIYFMTVINRSCSGQDIIIDNLESLNGVFVWE